MHFHKKFLKKKHKYKIHTKKKKRKKEFDSGYNLCFVNYIFANI